jgi:hypothetical protein
MLNGKMWHYFHFFELALADGAFDDGFFAQVQVTLHIANGGYSWQ